MMDRREFLEAAALGGGVVLTNASAGQRMFESPAPPKVCLDFWSSAYQAIDD
jgi:hypothetical protein